MSLITLGLNHKTAPVDVREQTSFAPEQINHALQDLLAIPAVNEAAIISTCNRTEIYCDINSADDNQALEWFLDKHAIQHLAHDEFLYRYIDASTVKHLLSVACGLDSMVLGEPQILGQLKTAYRQAEAAGTVGVQLSRLFQHSFAVAKHVRTETAIGANPVSVAFAAVQLSKQIFTNLSAKTALLVGAGETIELTARHLKNNQIGRMLIANRSIDRAKQLAKDIQAEPIRLAELSHYLPKADIVMSSTASQLPIIGKGAVESALKERKHRPIFMVDLAVPRDIEPETSELRDVYLYNIDDLEAVIMENRKSREQAAAQANTIIDVKVQEFMAWQRSLDAVHTIRHYRGNAQKLSDATLAKAKQMLRQGKDPEDALQYLAHTLTNKILHSTTVRLDQAAREGQDELLHAAIELFKADNPKKIK